MKTLHETELTLRFLHRLEEGKPFSFVRLGDGEATLLRYPEYESLDNAQAQVTRWWKEPAATDADIRSIRQAMLDAFQSADMLGIPHEREQLTYPKWNRGLQFERLMQYLDLPGRRDTDVFYFYHLIQLHKNDVFHAACKGRKVRLITCRPETIPYVKEKLEAASVQCKLIRAETFRWKAYASIDEAAELSAVAPPHWPDGYAETLAWIRAGEGAYVYLIGAGGLGKVYAHEARKAGSIGLDIGALFDGWVGLPTRPYIEGLAV